MNPALLVDWCEPVIQAMTSTVKEEGFEEVFVGDAELTSRLEQRGYTRAPYLTYYTRDLTLPLPEIRLPEGFHFLDKMQLEFAENRATAHFSAFEPSRMSPDYYRGFMNAPSYDPELDIVAVAPDGRFAAFAMGWADRELKISAFEPVGTHQDFQRKGLGTAVLREGMRRLKARGIETASVCCETDSAGNRAFYQNAGFTITAEIVNYMKPRPESP
jgi:mycothiol synthase